MQQKLNFVEKLATKLRKLFRRNPELPEDPYSYVPAPKKPQLPGRSAVAVADAPEE